MTRSLTSLAIAALVVALIAPAVRADKKTPDEQKADIRHTAHQTLHQLYQSTPSAKAQVEKAAGYAVFSNFGMKILIAGSGTGKGVAVNNKSKAETFMKMAQVQAGLGMGIKKFRCVFIFDSENDLNDFISKGWEGSGQTTAAAKTGGEGGAAQGGFAISEGVRMYQLTDKGLALEATVGATKFYKDGDLN